MAIQPIEETDMSVFLHEAPQFELEPQKVMGDWEEINPELDFERWIAELDAIAEEPQICVNFKTGEPFNLGFVRSSSTKYYRSRAEARRAIADFLSKFPRGSAVIV